MLVGHHVARIVVFGGLGEREVDFNGSKGRIVCGEGKHLTIGVDDPPTPTELHPVILPGVVR